MIEGIAANLATDLLRSGAKILHDAIRGDNQHRATRDAFEKAFQVCLQELVDDEASVRNQKVETLRRFVNDPDVSAQLLEIALLGNTPLLSDMQSFFGKHKMDTVTIDLLNIFMEAVVDELLIVAEDESSPIYNIVSLGKLRELKATLDNILTKVNELTSTLSELDSPRPVMGSLQQIYLPVALPKQIEDVDQVPQLPRKFVGRKALLEQVRECLNRKERILLQGFAGTGKTALAAQVASEQVAAGIGSVLWLKGDDYPILIEEMARILGNLDTVARASSSDRPLLLKQWLLQSHVHLIVFDNVNDSEGLREILQAIPASIGLIVTSRKRFALDTIIEVTEFSPEEALEMLSYHAHRELTRDSDAEALCRLLGNLAFSVEIAGRTLYVRNWRPGKLIRRIEAKPHDLTMPLEFSEEGRSSLADLLDASLNALYEKARLLFIDFGAFFQPRLTPQMLGLYSVRSSVSFGFTPEQLAEAREYVPTDVSAQDMWQSLQAANLGSLANKIPFDKRLDDELDVLQDNGLIQWIEPTEHEVGYFKLHDLAFSFAKAQVDEEKRVRALFACVSLAIQISSSDMQLWNLGRTEIDNLLAATDYAIEHNYHLAVEMIVDSIALVQPDKFLGLPTEMVALLKKGIFSAESRGNDKRKIYYLNAIATLVGLYLDDHIGARQYLEEALQLSRSLSLREEEANSIGNMGNIYFEMEDTETAIKLYKEALDIYRETGNTKEYNLDLGNLAGAYIMQGDFENGLKYTEECLEIYRNSGDKRAEAIQLNNLVYCTPEIGHEKHAA